MKFCSSCGDPVSRRVPEGDDRPRYICDSCSTIHYENPKIVAGCIPAWEGQVLLCRRAIEPRRGLWTLPAGFMENGETTSQAAERETLEEACARVRIEALYALFNLPHIDQVYMIFRAQLRDTDFRPGAESLEVALFAEHGIPWSQLAFPVITETLRLYFSDRAQGGDFPVRVGDIERLQGLPYAYRTALL
jgi:ADP-ribose pyrophosphatase YjhB (NUDIX family)